MKTFWQTDTTYSFRIRVIRWPGFVACSFKPNDTDIVGIIQAVKRATAFTGRSIRVLVNTTQANSEYHLIPESHVCRRQWKERWADLRWQRWRCCHHRLEEEHLKSRNSSNVDVALLLRYLHKLGEFETSKDGQRFEQYLCECTALSQLRRHTYDDPTLLRWAHMVGKNYFIKRNGAKSIVRL